MSNLVITFGKVAGLSGASVPLENAMQGLTHLHPLAPYSSESTVLCPPGHTVLTLYAEADCWWVAAGNNDDAAADTSERRRFLPAGIEKQYAITPGAAIRAVLD